MTSSREKLDKEVSEITSLRIARTKTKDKDKKVKQKSINIYVKDYKLPHQ